ncbi:resistin [Erinaceus europaeus]|uniref:Resistin n=1 Tax=Erinaceus europaeus TaxID=9365 RepID=A0A1S3ACU7_ERIEU|nr:resistin [Erinaceus europaeus]
MKAFLLLHLLLVLLLVLVDGESLCPMDEAISQKVQEATTSLTQQAMSKLVLNCRTVVSRGHLATCPAGFEVTGCTCGSACGSWDVRADTTCHCQCAGMDWTGARCCRVHAG